VSAAKHTPAPWHVGGRDACTIYDRYSQRLANSFEGVMVAQRSNVECEANARLIAAAPELLAELQLVYDRSYNPFEPDNQSEQYKRVGALIAKATGVSP